MAKYDKGIREGELKNKVAADWFSAYDTTREVGNIDFCVSVQATELGLYGAESVMWAEAKAGTRKDIHESFVQLILTIGKARTFDNESAPAFLGAFDAEKIAFLPYSSVADVFAQNDFNWNVTPSDHETKEFKQLYDLAKKTIAEQSLLFDYEADEAELRKFIKANFVLGRKDVSRIQITRNNFTHIYQKWRVAVLPSLDVENWDAFKKQGIIDADFFLADILSDKDNRTIRKKLYVLLQSSIYEIKYRRDVELDLDAKISVGFKDGQAAHRQFWNHYTRPPRKDYWDYIVERRDLLVDQDVRERKGAFFTPRKWVELSQEYLASELGENWQDEYVIWDCCAGTGNMEAGLTNKNNVWASTIDKADVDVMHTRIKMMNEKGGANLWDNHVFQFDFLNDSFDKLPKDLRQIVNDPEKRKKLIIYINPPYAEASNARTSTGTGNNRAGLSETGVKRKYEKELGRAANELFAQFYVRINRELSGAILGLFSTLKILQAPNFQSFRSFFAARLTRLFVVPADTFDNVSGKFPIGFQIWKTGESVVFDEAKADVYDKEGHFAGQKLVSAYSGCKYLIDWFRHFYDKAGEHYAYLRFLGTDFQNNKGVFITLRPSPNDLKQVKGTWVTQKNFSEACVYFAVRLCIEPSWLNDRDQFLSPNTDWEQDGEFRGNSIVHLLFHGQNKISCEHGVNHWIPFTEEEVGAQDCFESHFMSDFLAGKAKTAGDDLFAGEAQMAFVISPEAKAVLDAGRELWRYYHAQPKANPNASYYDIRKFFQGMKTTAKGKEQMNPTSNDEKYNELLAGLKAAMKKLAAKIEPKVYEYGFLRK